MHHTNPFYKPPKPWVRAFLHFMHAHEKGWNVIELCVIVVILSLLFLEKESASHDMGVGLEILTGLLLALKFISIGARKLRQTFGDVYGLVGINDHRVNIRLERQEICFLPMGDLPAGKHDVLWSFVDLCHDAVQDRSESFTRLNRFKLYREWLASKQPCLMSSVDNQGKMIVASVILPLTNESYNQYVTAKIDAIEIAREHIIKPNNSVTCQHLLIDIVALNPTLSSEEGAAYNGIGLSTSIRHLSNYFDSSSKRQPTLICSTSNKKLMTLLTKRYGFIQIGIQVDKTPIFGLDLVSLSKTTPIEVQKRIRRIILTIDGYRASKKLSEQNPGA